MDRVAADNKFYDNTYNLGLRGKLYGLLVKYGNKATRMGADSSRPVKNSRKGKAGYEPDPSKDRTNPKLRGADDFTSGGTLLPGHLGPTVTGNAGGYEDKPQPTYPAPTTASESGPTGIVYEPPVTSEPSSAEGTMGNFAYAVARYPGIMESLTMHQNDMPEQTKTYKPLHKKKNKKLNPQQAEALMKRHPSVFAKELKDFQQKSTPPGNKNIANRNKTVTKKTSWFRKNAILPTAE